ncbi:MAG: hypothetical protein K2M75_00970 [Clostridia bacterium]|nr:hypothetical protein [Clostridia bacterium]
MAGKKMDNRIAYGVAIGLGINTNGMKPYEVWQAIVDKQGVSVEQAMKKAFRGVLVKQVKEIARKKQVLNNTKSTVRKGTSKDEFFGIEYKGIKGADAIEKLLHEKQGHVKNAFVRKELGGIDLVWGDRHGGLLHMITKRDKLYAQGKGTIKGLDMARKLPEIIEKGKFGIDDVGKLNISYDNYRVGINYAYYDESVNWVVTAMEILE